MKKEYQTLIAEHQGAVLTLWLNRPQVHNALNGLMMEELLAFFTEISGEESCRIVVLRGKGPSFCSGADLAWMKEVTSLNYEQNLQESMLLARTMEAVSLCPKPVVSVVHGSVMGGAIGLAAASDIVLASGDARFRFGEVALGLVPAVISPYVVRKIGLSQATYRMLSASVFSSEEALGMGLVHQIIPAVKGEEMVEKNLSMLLENSPQGMAETKRLLRELQAINDSEELIRHTAGVIARARISEEGQKGLKAFFSGHKPEWAQGVEKSKDQMN